jgi:hypothetical protein
VGSRQAAPGLVRTLNSTLSRTAIFSHLILKIKMLGFVQVRGSMQKLTLFLNLCIIPALGSLKIKLAEEGTSSRGYFGEGVLNLRKQTESSELLVDRGISSGCFSLDSRVTRVAPEEEHSKSDGSQGTRGHTWETYDPIQSEERRQ